MMLLYVLRHAIAVPHGAPGFSKDSDRPLTEKGARKMARIARVMKRLGIGYDVILTSPFPRALQTAEIVVKELGGGKSLVLTEHLAVGGDPERLIEEILTKYASAGSVMIVGHEPYLSLLISMLLSGHANLDITMKKGGLAKLNVSELTYGRCASLEWLLTPGSMTRGK
jgi:phosphohistidine phosphatase